MLEIITIIGQTLFAWFCVVAFFVLTAAATFYIETRYKCYKKRKKLSQQRQHDRQRQLREHDAEYQRRLIRSVWQLESENIELVSRKINRQTIIINGKLATPAERDVFIKRQEAAE